MRIRELVILPLAAFVIATPLDAQGKGKGNEKGKDKDRGGESRGRSAARSDDKDRRELAKDLRKAAREDAKEARKIQREVGGAVALPRVVRGNEGKIRRDDDSDGRRRHKFNRVVLVEDIRPSLRTFLVNDRPTERVLVGAVSRAQLRGIGDNALIIRPVNDRVRLLNPSGVVLVDLDEDRARRMGRWDVVALDDRVKEGAPSFCRSGEGHPVFGRDWCIEKGFGLGRSNNLRWGRSDIDDVIFTRRVATSRLAADGLLGLLGSSAFDRLALHAVTLGLLEPLTGMWVDDPSGPRVLLVNSGTAPIAEIVDRNRDDRPEVLFVTRRDW